MDQASATPIGEGTGQNCFNASMMRFRPHLAVRLWFRREVFQLLPPPRFALTGYAWRSHAEAVRAERVRRSLSAAKA